MVLWYSSAAISTDNMNGRVCGALVQFGCYQYMNEGVCGVLELISCFVNADMSEC